MTRKVQSKVSHFFLNYTSGPLTESLSIKIPQPEHFLLLKSEPDLVSLSPCANAILQDLTPLPSVEIYEVRIREGVIEGFEMTRSVLEPSEVPHCWHK